MNPRAYRGVMLHRSLLALGLSLVAACGVDPAKVPQHRLYADDGAVRKTEGAVTFAVVGNTRGTVPGLDRAGGGHWHGSGPGDAILADIAKVAGPSGPRFLVHLGDGVRASSTAEWGVFGDRMAPLLEQIPRPRVDDGADDRDRPPVAAPTGIPGVPVAGDREAAGDKRYVGLGGAWPEAGADIGYNRVATWSAFDLVTAGHTWRVLVLDSGKQRLGSRWNEQRGWIKRAVKGDYDGILVFMHDPLLDLGGRDDAMNAGGGPAELLEMVEDATEMLKVRAVFGAGRHVNQALLPDGPFGAAHIGAGGGGAPAQALRRWGPADTAGRNEDVQLEPIFDLALMKALDRRARQVELPGVVVDEAKARDSFQGFTGAYHPEHFPTYGWWQVTAYGGTLDFIFHFREPSGEFREIYRLHFDEKSGWQPSQPDGR